MASDAFRPRLAIAQTLTVGTSVALDTAESHYLRSVLRAAPGTVVELFNGDGYDYEGTLAEVAKRCRVVVLARRANTTESPLRTELIQAISRGDRMDHSVQKAVELGVDRIVPVYTRRAIRALDAARGERKRTHWQSIAAAAAAQCGRARVPEIACAVPLPHWLDTDGLSTSDTLDIVLSPAASRPLVERRAAPSAVRLLVGPESGLDADEIAVAERAGFEPRQLGPRVLRTETAAPTALAVLQALYGDLGDAVDGASGRPQP